MNRYEKNDGRMGSSFRERHVALGFASALPLAGLVLLLGGCGNLSLPASAIPGEVDALVGRSSFFAQDNEQALLSVEAGTVMDDLSGLEGCWGAYFPLLIPDAAANSAGFFEYLRFDLADGSLMRQVYARDDARPDFVRIEQYDMEVIDADRIRVTLESAELRAPLLGTVVETPDELAAELPLELQLTLDGDRFSIANSLDSSRFLMTDLRLFRRLDCSDGQTSDP